MILHLIVYERSYADTSKTKWWRVERIELLDPSGLVGRYSDGETFIKKIKKPGWCQFGFKYQLNHPTRTVTNTLGFKTTATRLWQKYSGMAEVSHYGDLISRSCDSGPEFEVVYVNETLAEETSPNYDGCAMAGLKLKSSDNFNQLDQLRTYLKNGIEVERLTEGGTGSSNLLTDLLWYLVTNKDTGAGTILNSALVDKALLTTTGRYLVPTSSIGTM